MYVIAIHQCYQRTDRQAIYVIRVVKMIRNDWPIQFESNNRSKSFGAQCCHMCIAIKIKIKIKIVLFGNRKAKSKYNITVN